MLECSGCGNKSAHRTRTMFTEGGKIEGCDECMGLSTAGTGSPDVYLGGGGGTQTDENLVDPKSGKEVPFSSKREKAEVMKRLGVRQADSAERQGGLRESTDKKRTYFT